METVLVGANFRPSEAREAIKGLTIGSILTLEAEPDNPHDDKAVKVMLNGEHLGYIPRTDNSALAEILAAGNELTAEVIAFQSTLKPVLSIDLDA